MITFIHSIQFINVQASRRVLKARGNDIKTVKNSTLAFLTDWPNLSLSPAKPHLAFSRPIRFTSRRNFHPIRPPALSSFSLWPLQSDNLWEINWPCKLTSAERLDLISSERSNSSWCLRLWCHLGPQLGFRACEIVTVFLNRGCCCGAELLSLLPPFSYDSAQQICSLFSSASF